ncbi:MAG: hypothetical protein HS110_02860 [Zoogloeaceae bacterium]|nr:hypothetical protein [Zoogloeaceae bacterium]MCK6385359.1 hypothetical protein [Rhodocyclaceae bacterium]
MKKHKRRRGTPLGVLHDGFVKGLVSTGLIAAMDGARERRDIARTALLGGAALATASLVADALSRRSLPVALGALALGAGGLWLIDDGMRAATQDGKRGNRRTR